MIFRVAAIFIHGLDGTVLGQFHLTKIHVGEGHGKVDLSPARIVVDYFG